jgi:hypothetical protein
MTFLTVSCGGDKNNSGGSNSNAFSHNPSTRNGYYNPQTHVLEIGAHTYPPNQQYAMVMNQAIQQAQVQQIQPVMHNGVMKYRARVTAQTNNFNQMPQGGMNQGFNQGFVQDTLIISNVQFY